ncbi:hypothetical protein [Caproiciproducens sp. LBM24188]|nr:hypothetical protein [Oscillospiraceae bacterium]HHV33002.1 hypothetical protein [Clostridiales bacterium]
MEELPLGFGMALAMNPKAMERFSALPKEEQQKLIEHTHQIQSRSEMHNYVQSIADQSAQG